MQKCSTNKSSGIQGKNLFRMTLSSIYRAAPTVFLIVMAAEVLVGLIQTGTLIAWQYVVNAAEDFLIYRDSYMNLLLALAISLLAYIAMDLFRLVLESLHTWLNSRVSESMQSTLYQKCMKISAINYENSELYNNIERANKSIQGMLSVISIIGIFVMAASRIATLGLYVFFIKPILIVIILLPIVPILITRIIRGRDLYQLNFKQSEKRRECDYYQKCTHSRETRTLQAIPFFASKWDDLRCEINKEEKHVNGKHCVIFSFLNLLKFSIYFVAILVSAIYLFDGSIDVGTFALITGMLGTTHATIEVVVSRSSDIAGSLRYANDYFNFLNIPDEVSQERPTFSQSMELRNVSFTYPNSKECVLKDINLQIKKGEKIALVGLNGAGKTTLAKIISGLYNPTQGVVLLDNAIRSSNTLVDCSMVSQAFCKYYFTLRENVAIGNLKQLENDRELLHYLGEFDFTPDENRCSLDTQLGREFDGVELSIGEWQKIALARGFIGENDFIILDEPSSCLDSSTENMMFSRFIELLDNCTGIIITHRLGIAAVADRIILLDKGQIIEDGTHDELMKKHGFYSTLFETQTSLYTQ